MSTRLDELRQYTSNLSTRHEEVKQAALAAKPVQNLSSTQVTSRVDSTIDPPSPSVGSSLMDKATDVEFRTPSASPNNEPKKQSFFKTAFDVVDRGAGYFNQGIASTVDFVANALPRLEGAVFGTEPEATFTGQVLKPVTDATGKLKDWVDETVSGIDERVQNDTKGSKAASIAANLGSQVVAALPNAVLALLSGGGSAATQLAAQPTGVSGVVTSAATKALQNPMTGVSFAQSLGNGYEEAKASDASDVEAMTAATLSSLFNAAIETGGGVETLPGEIRGKDLSTAQKALEWVKSALEEGGEEVVQGVITNLTNKGVFDSDKPLVSTTDENAVINPGRMLQEFGSGAAVGGILGGGQVLGNAILNNRNRNTPKPTIDSIMPKVQAETQTKQEPVAHTPSNGEHIAIENLISNKRINNTDANAIINSPEMSSAFTDITGVELVGTTEQKRQLVRDTAKEWQNRIAENESAAQAAAEQAYAEDKALRAEQAVRDSGYRSYIVGMFANGGATIQEAQEILGKPELKTEWEAVTGKKLPENHKSAIKMIRETKRDPYRLTQQSNTSAPARDADAKVQTVLSAIKGVEVQPVQAQTTPDQKVADVVSRIIGENEDASVVKPAAKTPARVESTLRDNTDSKTADEHGEPAISNRASSIAEELNSQTRRYPTYGDWTVYRTRDSQGDGATLSIRNRKTGEKFSRRVEGGRYNTNSQLNYMAAQMLAEHVGVQEDAKPAMGAADYGFSPYSSYQNTQSQFIPEGANAARPVDVPSTDPTGKNTRRFLSNAMGAQAINENTDARLQSDFMEGKYGYEIKGDKQAVDAASELLSEKGYGFALAQTLERLQNMKELKQTVVDAQLLALEAQRNGRDADAAEILLLLAESGTEFGQAVQAYSIFRKLTPEGQLEGVRRVVERLNEKIAKKHVSIDEALAQKFLAASDEQTRADVMEEIYQDIGSKLPTTLGDIANQWRYTAMLLNPSTHAKNIGSNTTQLIEATIKDAIATIGEGVVDTASKLVRHGKGIQRTKAFLNPALKSDRQLLELAGNDYANARDEIMGVGKYQNTPEGKINQYKTTMKLNNPQNKVAKAVDAILRGAGKVAEWNSTAMDVEDTWFSKPRYQAALAGYMKANGLTEITAEARAYAVKEAQKSTYRDSNVVSDWARQLGNSRKKNWFTNSIDFVVNAIFPFKATPANVGVRAVEYSPVGLLTSIGKGVSSAIKGEFNAAAFIDDFSAGLTGTALAGVGLWLAQLGLLRAKGTGDDKEREQMEAEGYEQNAVQLFGHSVPISAFGAASVPMLFGAAIYENFVANNPDDEGHPIDDFLNALGGTLDPVLETTMLTGLQDAVKSFQQYDPEAGIATGVTKGIIDVVGDYVSTYIPTLLSRIANSIDTASRQVYVDKNDDAQQFQGAAQTWQKKIPGLRNEMTEVVDAYGDTVRGGLPDTGNKLLDVLGAIGNAVTPTYPSKIKTTAVDEEIRRLYGSDGVGGGDYTLIVSDAPKSFEVGNKTIYLTGDQYVQYQKTRNSTIQQIRGDIMNSDLYEDLPDDIRAAAMSDAYNYANALAKAGLDVGYKVKDTWMKDLAGASPEQVAETIIQRAINNAAEDKYQYENKYLGLETLLENKSIDDQMALACMSASCYDAYTANCEKADISVQQFLDAYGTACASSKKDAEQKQAALDYIAGLDISAKQKGALAQAVHEAIGSFVPQDTKLPNQWLLDIGDTNRIVEQMGTDQRQKYNTYIKGSEVETQTYLDMMEYYGSEEAKTKKDANGKPIEGHETRDYMEKYIRDLDVSDAEKGRLYCSIYAEKTCPKDLLVAAFGVETAEKYISDARKEGYEKYVKGSNIDILTYFDLVDYYNSSESDGTKGKDGNVIKGQSKQDKVLAWIAKLNIPNKDKGRLFCSLYSYKNCPRNWK